MNPVGKTFGSWTVLERLGKVSKYSKQPLYVMRHKSGRVYELTLSNMAGLIPKVWTLALSKDYHSCQTFWVSSFRI